MDLRWAKYERGDVFHVKLREGDPLGGPVMDYPGLGWTLKEGDAVLLCFGIANVTAGIGNLWAFISDDARGHGVSMYRFMKARIDEAFDVMRFTRLQAIVRCDRPEYARAIEMVGFQCEGRLRKAAANGDDVFLYARVE